MSRAARLSPVEASPISAQAAMIGAAIVILAIVANFPATLCTTIWDDDSFFYYNPLIHDDNGLQKIWFTTDAEDYFPLTYSTFWVEWRIWRDHRWIGYHAVNILLHAASAVLLWRVLKRLKVPAPWLGGLLFAVHPVATSSVAWLAERKNVLSMVFYLASGLSYLRYEDEPRKKYYFLALGFFLLALFSKSAVVVLPPALLLCVWWMRRDSGDEKAKAEAPRGLAARCRAWLQGKWGHTCARLLPFFALAIFFGLLQMGFHRFNATNYQTKEDTQYNVQYANKGVVARPEGFASRLAASGWCAWFYLWKDVWPDPLLMVYPRWQVDPAKPAAWLPLLALAAVFLLLWFKRRSWGRGLLFGLGYYILALGPVIGFFEISLMAYTLVADHWQYFALPGFCGLVAAGAGLAWKSAPWRPIIATAITAVVITFGYLAWQHATIFYDQETLWRYNLQYNPHFAVGRANLGNMVVLRAVKSANMGNLPVMRSEFEEAIAEYARALKDDPNCTSAEHGMAAAHAMWATMDSELTPARKKEMLEKSLKYYEARMKESADPAIKEDMDKVKYLLRGL